MPSRPVTTADPAPPLPARPRRRQHARWLTVACGLIAWVLHPPIGPAATAAEPARIVAIAPKPPTTPIPSSGSGPRDYLVRNWTTADGVPHNTVRALVISTNGYLWLGTANGLARFDGVRFTLYDRTRTPGLISDDIFDLFQDRTGALWIRTLRGLVRRGPDGGRFEAATSTNAGVLPNIGHFSEDKAGRVWMRNRDGVFRWDKDRLEPVPMPVPEQHINYITADPGGTIWFGIRNGLMRVTNDQIEKFDVTPSPGPIAADSQGRVWGLTGTTNLHVFENGRWSLAAALAPEKCSSLYAAPNGDIWIGSDTQGRVFRLRDGLLTEVNRTDGLEGNRVLGIQADAEGNIWLGLNAGGLYRLRERRLRVYGREQGLAGLNASSVTIDPGGTLWFNVMGATLHRFAHGGFDPIPIQTENKQPFEYPTAVAPADRGGIWAGTFFGSLPRVVDNAMVETIGAPVGTRALFTDREGRLWRGTRTAGIERFAGTNLTRFNTNNGLSFNNVYCFAQDREGAVWVGTEQGLNRIHQDTVTRFGPAEGLVHGFISTLLVDSRGTLWVGTLGGGLSGWTGSRFVTLTPREGLAHESVEQLIEDDHGHLWIGTRAGIMRVAVQQLHDVLDRRLGAITGKLLGRDEGIVRPNLWTEYQPATLKAPDGTLWFCSGSGVIQIDPKRFDRPAPAPLAHIEEFTVNSEARTEVRRAGSQFRLPASPERLEIRYTATSPSEPSLLRFQYRLVGYDRNWIEAGRTRVAGYAHLPPGEFRFQVKAVSNDGVWSPDVATVGFLVPPQFWQTTWFRLSLGAGCLLLLVAAHRLKVASLERRRAAQEAFARRIIESQETERQRIAAELHDSLGQNLLVIRNLALMGRSTPTATSAPSHSSAQEPHLTQDVHLREIADAASEALTEVRTISHALRPVELDRLGLTKAIEAAVRRMSESSGIAMECQADNIDSLIPADHAILLYRIVQESLNNIIKHSQAKSATVEVSHANRQVLLAIADDGVGFTPRPSSELPGPEPDIPNPAHAPAPQAHAHGLGLSSIVERARALGGHAAIFSRPGGGTRIEVSIPIR